MLKWAQIAVSFVHPLIISRSWDFIGVSVEWLVYDLCYTLSGIW